MSVRGGTSALLIAGAFAGAAGIAAALANAPEAEREPARLAVQVAGAGWVEVMHDMNAMGSMPGAPPHGSRRVRVELDIANAGTAPAAVPFRAVRLRDHRGRTLRPSGGAAVPVALAAGQRLAATATFDVPAGSRRGLRLVWRAGAVRVDLPVTPQRGSAT